MMGFVEEHGDHFEVMHPEDGLRWVSLPTLAQAVNHVIHGIAAHTQDR
ncbi:hypothetical protein [Rathayibacter soli]|nr:hypothetical protein [Glaciibacter superstes]